jgi:hypothetical protein
MLAGWSFRRQKPNDHSVFPRFRETRRAAVFFGHSLEIPHLFHGLACKTGLSAHILRGQFAGAKIALPW